MPPDTPRNSAKGPPHMWAQPLMLTHLQSPSGPHPRKRLTDACLLVSPAPHLLLARQWEGRGRHGSEEERKGMVWKEESGAA